MKNMVRVTDVQINLYELDGKSYIDGLAYINSIVDPLIYEVDTSYKLKFDYNDVALYVTAYRPYTDVELMIIETKRVKEEAKQKILKASAREKKRRKNALKETAELKLLATLKAKYESK